MQVILLERVAKLGQMGEVVRVKEGYARNFLLPQGKAIVATKGAEKQIATMKRTQIAREIRNADHANEVKQALEALSVTITARATADGKKLFGSITNADVASAIKAAGGPSLDKNTVDVGGHIKTAGSHPVSVKLHPGVSASFKVTVVTSA